MDASGGFSGSYSLSCSLATSVILPGRSIRSAAIARFAKKNLLQIRIIATHVEWRRQDRWIAMDDDDWARNVNCAVLTCVNDTGTFGGVFEPRRRRQEWADEMPQPKN